MKLELFNFATTQLCCWQKFWNVAALQPIESAANKNDRMAAMQHERNVENIKVDEVTKDTEKLITSIKTLYLTDWLSATRMCTIIFITNSF